MGHRFAELAFTPTVKALQRAAGSRANYARMEEDEEPFNDSLGGRETDFIAARDSFYLATVSETGWPYVQHRGGATGFVKVLDARTIGFADYRGNRQYVSVGNLGNDDRVSLIMVDYPRRMRLKILGHARVVGADEPELLARLVGEGTRARVERGLVIRIAAFDWNCPQHITPRYTQAEVDAAVAPLQARIAALEAALAGAAPG